MPTIPEAPFLFSIAGLSMSLAGFAGLVAALRRGTNWRAIDFFRLREIATFGLANVVLALLVIPFAHSLPGSDLPVRLSSTLAIVYVVASGIALYFHGRRLELRGYAGWTIVAVANSLAIVVAGGIGIAVGKANAYEWLLILLLIRPMLAFLLVLVELGSPEQQA